MRVDVISDFVCPWCFVGLRRLQRASALAAAAGVTVDVVWHPFLLNPDTPPEGEPYRAFMLKKFGSASSVDALHGRVRDAARGEELEIDFDALQIRPSTRLAHTVVTVLQAGAYPVAALVAALFEAHFLERKNIGDPRQLTGILARLQLPGEVVRSCVESAPDPRALLAAAMRFEVEGVPTYVFDGERMLAGAHAAEQLLEMFQGSRR